MSTSEQIMRRTFMKPGRDPGFNLAVRSDGDGVGAFDGPWDPKNDVLTICKRHCRDGRPNFEALMEGLSKYFESVEMAYAGTMGVLTAELDAKPNNAITLSGNNPVAGATYPGLTVIPLFVRTGGVMAATPGLILQPWHTIQRIVADPIDAQNGWKIAGGSVLCTNDPVPTLANDAAFSVLRPELSRLDGPMAQLYSRPVTVTSTLFMGAIHYSGAPLALVQGITVELQDAKCPDWASNTFGDSPLRVPFVNACEMVIDHVRKYGPEAAERVRSTVRGRWG